MRKTNDIDESIVRALSADARRSYADIGVEVGRSAPAIKRRVDKLCEEGAILGFTVRINPHSFSRQTEGIIELYCHRNTTPEMIRRGLSNHPEVVSASTVTGDADALVHVSVSGTRQFEQVLQRIKEEPFVERTKSSLIQSPIIRRDNAVPLID
ncbi:Lrp/AsnC ligand binding domain-containing protein [Streptomyces caniferus]|uniref:Lrp/AsnC ligand binding domain-containing protein n=1 Tax=Streptomyces caniferus TaxID=285557 RepID=A0ABZ1VM87_9ACTN|nr:Lrp/AsnC ligand binding domain-containing protein [Streptomyces caniferus]